MKAKPQSIEVPLKLKLVLTDDEGNDRQGELRFVSTPYNAQGHHSVYFMPDDEGQTDERG